MAKAIYHLDPGFPPKEFTVLKTNEDKTVDIGPEGGPAVVTSCRVVDDETPGCCSLVSEGQPPKETKTKK